METQKQIVTNNGILRGIVHIPDSKTSKGTIVIIHGYFSSQKIGPARLYVQIGRLLEGLGYCVYRFDATGVGDSDGDYSDLTFDSQKKDFLSIINDIQMSQINQEIILCGHSSGCNIAMRIASELICIKRMILISPAFGSFSGKEKLLSKYEINELHKGKPIYRKGMPINIKYIEQVRNETMLFTKRALSIETHIFIGKCDQFYDKGYIQDKSEYFKNCSLYLIDFADHNYLNPISRRHLFNKLKSLF